MARRVARGREQHRVVLRSQRRRCIVCSSSTPADYRKVRKVVTLGGIVALSLQVRRCHRKDCPLFMLPVRPEEEGRWALPQQEMGLDVIAHVGHLRYRQARSVPEMHQALLERGVRVSERTVTNMLDRYDELLALKVTDTDRIRATVGRQGRAILAIDGLQPDVGHEVLWVVRECLSGEVLLARALLSGSESELAPLMEEVKTALGKFPVVGIVSDGQRSIRNTVASVFPGIPHQLCHFHYLREAARPLYEADRHLKKELKKRIRGVRKVERVVEGRGDHSAQTTRAYCAAVRSALTDDNRPPLRPSGLRLEARLRAVEQSLGRLEKRGVQRGSAATSTGAPSRSAGKGRVGGAARRVHVGRARRQGTEERRR